jgi:hypothetical protein
MAEVIHTDQAWLDGRRYSLLGPITLQGLSTLPGRLVTGVATRDDEQIRSTWIMEDWAGGLGIRDIDPGSDADRYDYGTADTRWRRTAAIPPRAVLAMTDAPAGKLPRMGVVYNGTYYHAFDELLRFWSESGQSWIAPTEPSYVSMPAAATSVAIVRLGPVSWMVWADGNGTLRFDGTDWTYVAGDGLLTPDAEHLCWFDGKLWALDVNGELWSSSDLTTWNHWTAALPALPGDARRLFVYFDPDEAPALHTTARDGLWVYNQNADQWFPTKLSFPWHRWGGEASAEWQGIFFESVGIDAYSYNGRVITAVSPNRDDGLPEAWRGHITAMADAHNWLLMGISAATAEDPPTAEGSVGGWGPHGVSTSSAYANILAWTGSAFHPIWSAPDISGDVEWIGLIATAEFSHLWWAAGGALYYQDAPESLFNPRQYGGGEFEPEAWLQTGWFEAGKSERIKLAAAFELALFDCTGSGGRCEVYYGVNRSATWTLLTSQDTDRADPVYFGPEEEGEEWESVRFGYRLIRGPDVTQAPALDWAVFTYVPEVDRLYSATLTIDLSDEPSPREAEAALFASLAKKTMLSFNFRREGQQVGPAERVIVLSYHGITGSGPAVDGRHTIQLVGVRT